jgi:nuclear receptor coactivator 2
LNEKRRREQENSYYEELAELIQASLEDMNASSARSVKPDKCAILQETVNQIHRIQQEDKARASVDAVQQADVSSTKPTILANEVLGPLLLEVCGP